MSDYGTDGMPKVVVVGGASHRVYYNANNTVNGFALRDSILSALNAGTTGITEAGGKLSNPAILPNPASENIEFTFSLRRKSDLQVTIHDLTGKVVSSASYFNLPAGENRIPFRISDIPEGIYYSRLRSGNNTVTVKLVISR
jgi:hypothetical protein